MGFSTKQATQALQGNAGSQDAAPQEEWKAWEEYYSNLLSSPEKQSTNKAGEVIEGKYYKKTTAVGVLKVIVDCGTQPQPDSSYDSKCALPKDGEKYSEEEKAHIAKFPDNDFVWEDGKRKQTKPERNTQEYVLMYDFPKIMVNWTKHPLDNFKSLGVKPLRVSYNGSYTKDGLIHLGKKLRFNPHWKTGKLSPNNPLVKIANSSRVGAEFEAENYDLGVMVDSCCKWELTMERRTHDGKTYFQSQIKSHSEITEVEAGDVTISVEQQIPECPTEFRGILMNGGDYSDEVLAEVIEHRKELLAVLPRSAKFKPSPIKYPDFELGVEWEESDLCKALTKYMSSKGAEQPAKQEVKQENKPSPKPEPVKKVEEPTTYAEPAGFDDEFMDNIPF